MAARASGWVIWGLTASIVAFALVAYEVLAVSGGHVLLEKLILLLGILAVAFAAVATHAPRSSASVLDQFLPRSARGPDGRAPRHVDAFGPLVVGIVVAASLGAVSFVGIPLATTCACSSLTLGMSAPTETNPGPGLYWSSIAIAPTEGLTTGMFGIALTNATGVPIAEGAADASCQFTAAGTMFSAANCGPPTSGWYGVLYWAANGSVANTFGSSTGVWTTPVFPVSHNETLVVVSPVSLANSSDVLHAFPTGVEQVWGSSGKF